MKASAALLNDVALTNFTYVAQIPYLNMALVDLKEILELNNVPITNQSSNTALTITAGVTKIARNTNPSLPLDLIEIRHLWERDAGTTEDFMPMTKKEFLPNTTIQISQLVYWAWINDELRFVGATTDRDLRMDYVCDPFAPILVETDVIHYDRAQAFLNYRTAALCAQFIGENKERSDDLNTLAGLAVDRTLGITTKPRQAIATRRRPFMASLKVRRGY